MKTGFFAYPGLPRQVAQNIRGAIVRINETNQDEITMQDWATQDIAGSVVVDKVLHGIDSADVFCCDLTVTNENVLFEFGYAIAKNKRVWVSSDSSFSHRDAIAPNSVFSTIGYVPYTNSYDLSDKFFKEQPYNTAQSTFLQQYLEPSLLSALQRPNDILYLRSPINTNEAIAISRAIQKSSLSIVVDDPVEVARQSIAWYAENVFRSSGVVAHFLDDDRKQQGANRNPVYAFVAGLVVHQEGN